MEWDVLGIVFRWLHILAAITAVGGTIFMRFALLPAMAELPEATRKSFHEAVRSRWARPVQLAILFLLISGVFNIISMENQYDLSKVRLYHPLFGVKFLLALAIFFLASVLTGRSARTQRFRDNRRLWLTVNLVLAVLVVCISGVLRKSDPPKKPVSAISASRPMIPAGGLAG
jgi:uncharacterized membrane protein